MSERQTNRRQTRRTDARHASPEVRPASELFDRAPPHSPEAEKGVIGSLLLDPRVLDDVALAVKVDEFYSPSYAKLYETALAIHNAHQIVDVTLLVERLTASGDFEMLGGMAMLLDVAECVPTAANAVHYAKIIREKAQLRALIHASTETLRDAYDPGQDTASEIIGRAESRIMQVSMERAADQVTDAPALMHELLTMIDADADSEVRRIKTGYHDLDDMAPVKRQQVIVVAARPSLGKSAFAMNLMENLSSGDGALRGVFFTLEMSRLELGERMLCSASGIPIRALRQPGLLTSHDRKRIIEASSALSTMPIYIDDTPGRNVNDIAAVCRRFKRDARKGGLDYVIVDYLQIIEPEASKEHREVQVSTMSRRLKRLARELDAPIFLLSQLNRQTEETKDNRPRLRHLRESGAIEQDADQVWFLHRDDYYAGSEYEKQLAGNKAEVIVAKQRGGPTGTVKLVFFKERCRFENAARDEIT